MPTVCILHVFIYMHKRSLASVFSLKTKYEHTASRKAQTKNKIKYQVKLTSLIEMVDFSAVVLGTFVGFSFNFVVLAIFKGFYLLAEVEISLVLLL